MSKVRFSLSVLLANFSGFAAKKLNGSEGTSLPGVVALKCYSKFFQVAQSYCKKSIVSITGTNGKTTSAGVLAHILQKNGNTVIHNENGANMLSGIASSIARGLKNFRKKDYFVLECDEAYVTKLYDFLNSNYLLVTNLFRDQLDRYGAIDATYNKIQEAIDKTPNLTVVLNADDPATANLGANNKRVYFGIEEIVYHDSVEAPESSEKITCKCGADFEYDKLFYAHIGHYKCNCGNNRKKPDYSAQVKIYTYKSEMIITHNDVQYGFTTYMPGVYNAYNALGSIVTALELGIDKLLIQKALNTYEPTFGRTEKLKVKGKNAFIQLIKNPVAMAEALKSLQNTKNAKLMIIMNDNIADGRDVSWLWDTDFSILDNFTNKVYLSGERAHEVALRLQYADFDIKNIKINKGIKSSLNTALKETKEDETLVILPSYTALLSLKKYSKNF